MRRRALAAANLAALLTSGAAQARGDDVHYACEIKRTAPLGELQVEWRMTPAGAGSPSYAFWTTENLSSTTLSMSWSLASGVGPPPDDALVSVTHWYTHGRRRVELRRDDSSPPLVGPYDGHRWQATMSRPLVEMRAFVGDARSLEVRAVDRRGRVLGTGRLDAAALNPPAAGLRAEIDAVLGDFRNRCQLIDPANEIVVAP